MSDFTEKAKSNPMDFDSSEPESGFQGQIISCIVRVSIYRRHSNVLRMVLPSLLFTLFKYKFSKSNTSLVYAAVLL